MKEQMENEGILNVYELAKFYYLKRPGIWRDNVRITCVCVSALSNYLLYLQGDLLFLYRCADVLLHNS